MTPTWQTTHQRGQQTIAVWQQFDPAFTFGEATLASHTAAIATLPPAAQAVATQQDIVDMQRDLRDATLAVITGLARRMPRKLDGDLLPSDPLHSDLRELRNIEMEGIGSTLQRGQMVVSLWTLYNARLAALVPPRPPITIGGQTVADLIAATTGLAARTQAVEDERSALREARSALHAAINTVDSVNKRWFDAWVAEYPPGTPENDALSQIDTGYSPVGGSGGGGGGGGGGGPTVPGVPQGFEALSGTSGSGNLTLNWTAVPGATSYKIRSGAPGPEQLLVGEFTGTTTELNLAPGTEVTLTISALNAAGESAQSAPVTGTAG